MKKLLLLAFFACLYGGTLSAQHNFDLSLRDSIVTGNRPDTVVMGRTYDLYLWVENVGTDTFNGDMAFRAFVAKRKEDLNYENPQTTFILDSIRSNHYSIAPGEKVSIKRTIYVSDKYFEGDTSNIVIVWPSGSNKPGSPIIDDKYRANSFARPFLKLFVEDAVLLENGKMLGLNEAEGPAAFRLAPNPAHDRLWLQLRGGEKGTLTLRDLQGRVLMQHFVQATDSRLSFSLLQDGKPLAPGIYSLTFRTDTGVATRKFVVSGE